MNQKSLVFLLFVLNLSFSVSQLTDLFLRPAYNVANLLSGNYFTEERISGPNKESTTRPKSVFDRLSALYEPEPTYRSNNNYQPQPNYQASACGSYWSYQNDYNEKWGLLSIQNPNYEKNVVKVVLTVAARLDSEYVGSFDLLHDTKASTNDVARGQPLQYRIKFPLQNPLPKIQAIYLNNQVLCTEAQDVASSVTTINLDNTFVTGLSGGSLSQSLRPSAVVKPAYRQPETTQVPWTQPPIQYQRPQTIQAQIWIQPPAPTPRQPVIYQPAPQVAQNFQSFEFECGVSDYRAPVAIGLVLGGLTASRGQFPWLAAYFHNSPSANSGFICGGSLVSTKIVVTAAHCVHEKHNSVIRKAHEATFYIGKHNLESLSGEQNFVISGVTELIIHPQWDYKSDAYDADIAVAVLLRTVSFSKFVKPICLWTQTTSARNLYGKKGIVAGWGKTEVNAVSTPTPKWAEIPVVDESTCLRSNLAFTQLTSSRTFCAGSRDGNTAPCTGDSGGGFVTNIGNSWYLRGVISASLFDNVANTCDATNYAVFTDITMFTTWIRSYIQIFG